jgi:hypothetical protein
VPATVPAGRIGADLPGAAYRPPPDGLLRKEQVERYVQVLEAAARESRPSEASAGASASSALVDEDPLVARDLMAARKAGFPEEEFLWIRERVLEAEASVMSAKLNSDVIGMLERTLGDLRGRRTTAADAGSRQLVDEQIKGFETELARVRSEAAEPEPDTVRKNVRMLEPFRSRVAALQAEIDRTAPALHPQRKGQPTPHR